MMMCEVKRINSFDNVENSAAGDWENWERPNGVDGISEVNYELAEEIFIFAQDFFLYFCEYVANDMFSVQEKNIRYIGWP